MAPVDENRVVWAIEASRASLRRAAPADSGHSALVYLTKRGEYEVVKGRLTMAELWLATPREAYIVDTAPHVDTFQLHLPSEDQMFSFSVEVAVRWHVADPISAVRAQLKSPKEEIKQSIELSLRATSRKFAAERWAAAEERMNSENLHRSTALPSGVMIDSYQVRLELAGETKEHVAELQAERVTTYADALREHKYELLALPLAGHHDDVNEVIGLLMKQRQVEFEGANAILTSLLDANLVNRKDVAAIMARASSTIIEHLSGKRALNQADAEEPRKPVSDSDAGESPDPPSAHSTLATPASDDGGKGDPASVAGPNPQIDSTEPPMNMLVEDLDTEVFPVVVYLADPTHAAGVEQALEEMLAAFGGAVVLREPPILRSWFRRMGVRFRRAAGSDAVRRLGRELDRAVELRAVDEIQAKVDAAQGEAVAKLLTALANTPTALIQIGSVLLVKINEVPVVRNLTQAELVYMQRNPDVVRDPASCLDALQRAANRGLDDDQAGVAADRAVLADELADSAVTPTGPSGAAAQ